MCLSFEHMNNFERFNEKKIACYKIFLQFNKKGKNCDDSKISDGHISFKDYLASEKIQDKLDIKDIGDYNDHYLKKDVLLLVYVFEKFIDTSLKFDGLDPCHYFSFPGLS